MIGYLMMYIPIISLLLFSSSIIEYSNNIELNVKKIYFAKVFLFYAMTILLIWAILRGKTTSIDLKITYLPGYNEIVRTGTHNHYDILFIVINRISYIVFHDFQGLLIITSIIFIAGIYLSSKTISANPAYTLFLFIIFDLYYRGLNQIRQYTGLAIVCIAICCFIKNKKVTSLLLIVIAGLIHTVCFVFLIIFVISKVRISKKAYIMIILISPILLIFGQRILFWIFTYVGNGQYSKYALGGGTYNVIRKLLIPLFQTWGLSIIYVFNFDKVQKEDCDNIFINFLLIATVISILGNTSSEIIRVVTAFFMFQFFFIPSILKYIKENTCSRLLWNAYILANLAYFALLTYEHMRDYPYVISDFYK